MKLVSKLCLFIVFAIITKSASAQTTITTFNRNGQLTWTHASGTNGFSVEWSSTAGGPWSTNWQGLDSVITAGAQTTVSVPMFYRVRDGFTLASLRGPWIIEPPNDTNSIYALFDGAGAVTELGIFSPLIPCGYYTVQSTGTVDITFFFNDGPGGGQGTFVSGQQIDLVVDGEAMDQAQLFQVSDPSKCQGDWTGSLEETNGTITAVSFDVNASGLISNFAVAGVILEGDEFVVGRMLSDSGNRVAAFFRSGGTDPYSQVQVSGTLSGNTMTGVFFLDSDQGEGGPTTDGSVDLQRQ